MQRREWEYFVPGHCACLYSSEQKFNALSLLPYLRIVLGQIPPIEITSLSIAQPCLSGLVCWVVRFYN